MFKKRLIQYSLFWLYTVLSLIIPCYLMIEKYGIFKEPNAKKLTFCAIFVIILCFFYFRKHLSKAIDNLTPCFLKSTLMATREIIPLVLIFISFYGCYYLLENNATTMLFIIKWTCILNIIAYFVRIIHLRYCDKVKEYYQMSIVKKAIK